MTHIDACPNARLVPTEGIVPDRADRSIVHAWGRRPGNGTLTLCGQPIRTPRRRGDADAAFDLAAAATVTCPDCRAELDERVRSPRRARPGRKPRSAPRTPPAHRLPDRTLVSGGADVWPGTVHALRGERSLCGTHLALLPCQELRDGFDETAARSVTCWSCRDGLTTLGYDLAPAARLTHAHIS
jgi:hypothetical protein